MKRELIILCTFVFLVGLGFFLGMHVASLSTFLLFSPPSPSFLILETTPGETIGFTVLDVIPSETSVFVSYRPWLLGDIRAVSVEGMVRDASGSVQRVREAFVLGADTSVSYSLTLPLGTFVRLTLDDGRSRAWTDIQIHFPAPSVALSPPERSTSFGILVVLFLLLLGVIWLLYLLFRHSHHSLLFHRYARHHHPGGYIALQHS